MSNPRTATYSSRAATHHTPLGRTLLALIARKRTNLCVSLDQTSPASILALLSQIGPLICVAKTHIDALYFSSTSDLADFTASLQELSEKHDFLIFEDRKFADIGNTVKKQYGEGIYRIADWAHITNAHTVPGPGVIDGLHEVVKGQQDRGLLLLGEMSSKGMLAGGEYLQKTLVMAREERNRDWVMGFIAMGAVGNEDEDWIVMTPGVDLGREGDGLGQQYKTPARVIGGGSDVIIVGRGIYENKEPAKIAGEYREQGWRAYLERVGGKAE